MKRVKTEKSTCESCGGDLKFSAKTQTLYCEKCKTEKPIEKKHTVCKQPVEDLKKKIEDSKKAWIKENILMGCPNCGAKLVHDEKDISAKCPYCGTALTIAKSEISGLCPDEIIPFAFDEEMAAQKFVEGVKKKRFLPNAFKKQLPKNKITGVYIPSFVFDATTQTNYSGGLEKRTTHTDSDGHAHTEVSYYKISGIKAYNHKNMSLEISSQINQNELESIVPYNEENVFDFNEDFIKGYTVEQYNEEIENCYTKYREMLDNKIKNSILSGYSYTRVVKLNMQTIYQNELFAYRIVPVYIFEYTFKGKPYRTIMNGNDGKIGSGLPTSKLKKALVVLIPFIIFFIISVLIFLFAE